MENRNPLKRLFDLYTSDMSYREIEKLIKQESSEVYQYFAKDLPKENGGKNKIAGAFIFLRNLFNAFIMKLSPARRLFYIIAMVLVLMGFINQNMNNIAVAVVIFNILLIFELFDKLILIDEISIAKNIQTGLIPKTPPVNEHYDIAAYYEGAREISGDYYDFIQDEDRLYLVVGDISGKGIPAALYMVRVQAILHTLVKNFKDIKTLLTKLKSIFIEKLEPGYFLTCILSEIDKNGKISLARAGHNTAILYRKKENIFEDISSKGLGIGFKDNGMFEKILEVKEIETNEGDIIFFYTDGAIESMNQVKEQFGEEKLKNIIKHYSDKPVNEIIKLIKDSIHFFRDENLIHDDMTMIILKRKTTVL